MKRWYSRKAQYATSQKSTIDLAKQQTHTEVINKLFGGNPVAVSVMPRIVPRRHQEESGGEGERVREQ